jgi:CheY-like chemotaxis protein
MVHVCVRRTNVSGWDVASRPSRDRERGHAHSLEVAVAVVKAKSMTTEVTELATESGRVSTPPEGVPSSSSGGFRAHVQKPWVLVVDDDASGARQLAIALELEGMRATTANNADDALSQLSQDAVDPTGSPASHRVDLVVIELMLPRRNGLELARELRARYPDIRIVLTGSYHLSERQLARTDCGAIAFVPKPCSASEVAAFVRQKVTRARESLIPPPASVKRGA